MATAAVQRMATAAIQCSRVTEVMVMLVAHPLRREPGAAQQPGAALPSVRSLLTALRKKIEGEGILDNLSA